MKLSTVIILAVVVFFVVPLGIAWVLGQLNKVETPTRNDELWQELMASEQARFARWSQPESDQ